MKKIKTILAILPALLFSCAGDDVEKYIPPTPITPSEPGEEVVYHKRAKEQFDLINQCYRINSGATEGLYNENYPKKDGVTRLLSYGRMTDWYPELQLCMLWVMM